VIKHYEFNNDYHSKLKGYENYADAAKILRETGLDKAAETYASQQAFGTPQQILDKLEQRRSKLGDFEWNVCTSYAGMPFKDRLYGVAMSPDTAPVVGELGGRMMFFIQFSLDQHLPGVEIYREAFRKHQHRPAPPPLAIDFTFCDRDAGRAEEMILRYAAGYYLSVIKHYEFNNDYHAKLKGYENYANAAQLLRETGLDKAAETYASQQAYGTPQQILDKLEQRRSKLGDFEWNVCSSFAGMPFKDVESSMRLLGKEVLPEVKRWGEDSFEPVRASA